MGEYASFRGVCVTIRQVEEAPITKFPITPTSQRLAMDPFLQLTDVMPPRSPTSRITHGAIVVLTTRAVGESS